MRNIKQQVTLTIHTTDVDMHEAFATDMKNRQISKIAGKELMVCSTQTNGSKVVAELREVTRVQMPWKGEGLPPVGTTVEIHRGKWNIRIDSECFLERSVTVAAVFTMSNGTEMVAVDGGPEIGCEVFSAECVRPVRTPEQIAAEDREKAVFEIAHILIDNRKQSAEYNQAGLIYDAGYRKMMSDAEEVKS